MEYPQPWNKLPSLTRSGLSDDLLWRHLLHSGTGETPAYQAGASFRQSQWIHIDHSGKSKTIDIDRNYLIKKMRLRYRDLAAIDPTLPLPAPSVILVRARAIAINLDVGGAIRLIICENQVYILSVPKANDPAVTSLPTQDHPFVKWLCSCLRNSRASSTGCYLNRKNDNKNVTAEDSSSDILNGNETRPTLAKTKSSMCSIITPAPSSALTTGVSGEVHHHHHHHHHNQTFDIDMPYELRALEVSLIAAMGILTAEINDLEAWGVPAVDALLLQVCRETLETVRKLKNSIDRLKAKVQRLVIEISDLLEDDDDMYDLYLGRRAELQGLLPLPQPGEVHDVIDHEIEQAGRGTGGMVGGDVADSIEQEERVREAEEELEDRQRERNRARNRERRREQHRQGGGRSSRQSSHYSGNGNGANRIHRNHDEDDVYSIADSLHDIDSEEEDALEQAEEDFLLRQRSFDNNGGAAGGSSSLFGGIANRANRIDPHDIEEAEDLLETMFERADMLLRRLSLLDERCEDTEALLELDLDQKRNQLVGLNVVVSAMSMSFGFAAAIGGIFGMNLKNSELAEDGWVLAIVLAVMLAGCTALLVIVFGYMQYKKLMFIPTTV